jgi:conjugative transfer region protein (TIGR03748 family)
MSRNKTLLLSVLAMTAINTNAIAQEQLIEQNGYTQIVVDTAHVQKHPLNNVTTISLPKNVRYVGQALNYILYPSGYSLGDLKTTESEVLKLYSMTIPVVNRSFKRASVKQIVSVLVGQGYELRIDDQTRTINIETLAKSKG